MQGIAKRFFQTTNYKASSMTHSILPHCSNLYNSLDWNLQKGSHHSLSEFGVVSFNLLAPCYKRLPYKNPLTGGRYRESNDCALWKKRVEGTLEFFTKELFPVASILALQEFWLDDEYCNMFEAIFQQYGYKLFALQVYMCNVVCVYEFVKYLPHADM